MEKIQGKKVNLRILHQSDAEAIASSLKNKLYSRVALLPYPYTIDIARKYIRKTFVLRKKKMDYCHAIEDKVTGELIGMLGLHGTHNIHRRAEIGYWLAKKFWGKGIMTEAVTLATNFAFKKLRLNMVHAHVFSFNLASRKVLEKCGYKQEGYFRKYYKIHGKYVDCVFYTLLREESSNKHL